MTRYCTPEGAYEIDSVSGQPQVAHCHGFFVKPECRGKGAGHRLKAAQMAMLQRMAYDFALCTVLTSNVRQKKILARAGWLRQTTFINQKTGDKTELWTWDVAPAGEAQAEAEREAA